MDEKVREIVAKLKSGLASIYGDRFKGVYLFGSRARGDHDDESDIDILIILDDVAEYAAEIERTGELVSTLSLEYGVSISRVFASEKEWDEGRTPFLLSLKKEAVRG